jgi:agmatine deiminase
MRMPAEWEAHQRTLVCWPARDEIWGDLRRQAELDHAELVRAVARFEPVTVIARPEHAEQAADLCAGAAEVLALPIDDSWVRDSGPIVVTGRDGRVARDFRFNAWGEKFHPYADDARLVERWSAEVGMDRTPVDLVLEGGAVTVDGEGTLLTTEQCLLHPNRNPGHSRREIEAALEDSLGVREVVWMPYGLALDDDTDGHVDNVATFVRPGVVLLQGCDDPDEADHHRLAIDRRCVVGHVDARGIPIQVVEVPVLPFTVVGGERRPVPYLNLYQCNGGVVVPVCGHPADADVLGLLAEVFAGREVVPVPGAVLALGGGGPHCVTQQIPAPPAP